VFLKVNGKQALWHISACRHFEGTDLSREDWGERGGSLTTYAKVLGGTVDDLKKWATEHNLKPRACSHCMKESSPIPANPKDGFILLEQADAIATERKLSAGPSVRTLCTIQRIVRDTQRAGEVKVLHKYLCQICGETIVLPDGRSYAEAHHIRPLGNPHNGPNDMDNILCVCPNHHVGLDKGCFPIEREKLRTCAAHGISNEHVNYHNSKIYRGAVGG
jgi:5-methylcytosine-specific restriction endonuclease McrA